MPAELSSRILDVDYSTPVSLANIPSPQTFAITVVNSGGYGNVFAVDGVSTPVLYFVRTGVYTFVQSAASNAGHQLAFKDGAGNSYTTGVVTTGTPGTAGAQTVITVAADAPGDLRYYCVAHGNGMGNTITVTNASMAVVTSAADIPAMSLSTVLANTVISTTLLSAGETITAGLINDVAVLPTYMISGGEPPVLYDLDTASQIWYVS